MLTDVAQTLTQTRAIVLVLQTLEDVGEDEGRLDAVALGIITLFEAGCGAVDVSGHNSLGCEGCL